MDAGLFVYAKKLPFVDPVHDWDMVGIVNLLIDLRPGYGMYSLLVFLVHAWDMVCIVYQLIGLRLRYGVYCLLLNWSTTGIWRAMRGSGCFGFAYWLNGLELENIVRLCTGSSHIWLAHHTSRKILP